MDYPITENKEEIRQLGRQMMTDNPRRYPAAMRDAFVRTYLELIPDEQQLTNIFHAAIYHQQMYGTSLIEYAMYGFEHRNHAEKAEYVTWFGRYLYMAFLNKERDLHLLDNKYEAYTLLKPFYKREAMLLAGEEDFDTFCDFAGRHKSIFVKPVNMDLAEGVHRLSTQGADLRKTFHALLDEAQHLASENITRPIDHRLILEEEIVQSPAMAQFTPHEMSLLRVTTITIKGKVHFFYPCLRMMCGDGQDQHSETYSIEALIDAETGVVLTDGLDYFGAKEFHPVTGTRIKGFQLPQWQELLEMLEAAALKLPTLRYIGWDVAHSNDGWCIVEGNSNGELCMSQMCAGHGVKHELEELIEFRVPFGFMLEKVEQLIEDRKNRQDEREN